MSKKKNARRYYEERQWVRALHEKYYHMFQVYEKERPLASLATHSREPSAFRMRLEQRRPVYDEGEILRGIEVPDGWQKLTEKLLEELDQLQRNNLTDEYSLLDSPAPKTSQIPKPTLDDANQIKIFQIKEKFGTLRVYLDSPPSMRDCIERTIGYFEGQADLTCSECGKVGEWSLMDNGWNTRLCSECERSLGSV